MGFIFVAVLCTVLCEIFSGILNLLYLIQARQKSGQMQGDQQKVLDELRSLKEIMKDAKQCPKCKMAISKTEGCNKMVCWNCKEYFCYQCNSAITGYEHFR
jgi:E3 ubiquitin-protein ligase RNF14